MQKKKKKSKTLNIYLAYLRTSIFLAHKYNMYTYYYTLLCASVCVQNNVFTENFIITRLVGII